VGLLQHGCDYSTLKNGDCSTNNALDRNRIRERWIADQHPTNRDRHVPATVLDVSLGVDFDLALLPALPMIALNLRPLRFRITERLLWIRAARAFH
jgi:hypothetical protein